MELRQNNIFRIATWAIRYQGFGVTVLSFLFKAIALTGLDLTRTRWYTKLRDEHFDKKFNIDSAGSIALQDLDVDESRIEELGPYQASTPLAFHLVISTLQIPYENYTFIDIGSGKGRAVFMAAEYPFKAAIGVELSTDLHDAAVANIETYRSRTQKCFDVRAENVDATSFTYPDGPLLLYFYNPFKEKIMRQVLAHIRETSVQNPRPIVLVYFHPSQKHVFDEQDFLLPVAFEEQLRGPVRRLMPVHRSHQGKGWVALYETRPA